MMKLPIPILSAIELAINTWLKLDDSALIKFEKIEGKIICFHITDIDLDLYFFPAPSGIQVLGNYPNTEEGGVVDATIYGSMIDLIRLSTSKDSGEAMLKSDVEVDGDMRVAEAFSAVLREVDIDWESLLSNLVGEFFAHKAAQAGQYTSSWFSDNANTFRNNTAEYLTEESNLSPITLEVHHFIDQVDTLRQDVDRLDARIKLLQDATSDSSNKEKE